MFQCSHIGVLTTQRLSAISAYATISKDNTAGEEARRADLLAHLGRRSQHCMEKTLRQPAHHIPDDSSLRNDKDTGARKIIHNSDFSQYPTTSPQTQQSWNGQVPRQHHPTRLSDVMNEENEELEVILPPDFREGFSRPLGNAIYTRGRGARRSHMDTEHMPPVHDSLVTSDDGPLQKPITRGGYYKNYYIYTSCVDPAAHFFRTSIEGDRKHASSKAPHERYIVVPGHCPLCDPPNWSCAQSGCDEYGVNFASEEAQRAHYYEKHVIPYQQPHNNELQRDDGIRKNDARFHIPADRNLSNIDELIRQSTDERETKKLKQQKRLLRNRQAALDSRQRKKQHTERLEDEKRQVTISIGEVEEMMQYLRIPLKRNASELIARGTEVDSERRQTYLEEDKAPISVANAGETFPLARSRVQRKLMMKPEQLRQIPLLSEEEKQTYTRDLRGHWDNYDASPEGSQWRLYAQKMIIDFTTMLNERLRQRSRYHEATRTPQRQLYALRKQERFEAM